MGTDKWVDYQFYMAPQFAENTSVVLTAMRVSGGALCVVVNCDANHLCVCKYSWIFLCMLQCLYCVLAGECSGKYDKSKLTVVFVYHIRTPSLRGVQNWLISTKHFVENMWTGICDYLKVNTVLYSCTTESTVQNIAIDILRRKIIINFDKLIRSKFNFDRKTLGVFIEI